MAMVPEVVKRVVAGAINRREWRSSAEDAAIASLRKPTQKLRTAVKSYIRTEFDRAGAGLSGRWQDADALRRARQTQQAQSSRRAMAAARGNNTSQARGGMQSLMRQSQERGRVSGPAARGNYAKTERSG